MIGSADPRSEFLWRDSTVLHACVAVGQEPEILGGEMPRLGEVPGELGGRNTVGAPSIPLLALLVAGHHVQHDGLVEQVKLAEPLHELTSRLAQRLSRGGMVG